jgi:hypothetical protein
VDDISRALISLGLDLPTSPHTPTHASNGTLDTLEDEGPALWDPVKPLTALDKFSELQTTFQIMRMDMSAHSVSELSLQDANVQFHGIPLELQSMTPDPDWCAAHLDLAKHIQQEVDDIKIRLEVCHSRPLEKVGFWDTGTLAVQHDHHI